MNNALAILRRFGQPEKRRTGSGLSVAELERWMTFKDALDPTTGATKDGRSSFRVPTHLVCTFSVHDFAEGAVVTDLSRGRAFRYAPSTHRANAEFRSQFLVHGNRLAELPNIPAPE